VYSPWSGGTWKSQSGHHGLPPRRGLFPLLRTFGLPPRRGRSCWGCRRRRVRCSLLVCSGQLTAWCWVLGRIAGIGGLQWGETVFKGLTSLRPNLLVCGLCTLRNGGRITRCHCC